MGRLQVVKIFFRDKQQRLAAHHPQIALVKNIFENIRLRLQPRAEPLDELPVFLDVLALDDDDEVVLLRKFFAEREVVLVIALVGADQIVAVSVELEPHHGDGDAGEK